MPHRTAGAPRPSTVDRRAGARRIRGVVRRPARWVIDAFQHLTPARLVPLPEAARPSTVAVVSIYRRRNAAFVRALLRDLPAGALVRLWALDEVEPALADVTVGSGSGGRLALLNVLIGELTAEPDMLVVVDDDVRFVVGNLARLLHAGSSLGLDVFQPAHSRRSISAYPFVRMRVPLVARETTFVEQGPFVVFSRRAQRRLLPLPGDMGMGWGVEARWHAAARESGLRQGIVDAVAIRHPNPYAKTYETTGEHAQLAREVAAAGLSNIRDLQVVVREIGPVHAWRAARANSATVAPGSADR